MMLGGRDDVGDAAGHAPQWLPYPRQARLWGKEAVTMFPRETALAQDVVALRTNDNSTLSLTYF